MNNIKPIQVQIVACDFRPDGYEDGTMKIELTAPDSSEIRAGNAVLVSHAFYKKALKEQTGC